MTRFCVAMPVPSGIEERASKFAEEVTSRFDEFRASRRKLGVTRERGWLQHTPQTDLFILMLEGADPIEANRRFAASEEPFDVWFKDRAGSIFGADFGEPIPVQPEPIYSSVPESSNAKQAVAVVLPLVPGKTDAHRRLAKEVSGPRKDAFDKFHERAGVTEDWWIEPTPMGDMALVYLESDDLAGAMGHLAVSNDDTEVWFKERLLETEGIDWSAPPPPLPTLLFDWLP